ncbi:YesL family protein [Bacillus sp. A301a_S52]|nr:YesL family protein [Bacillus sp. A301a_S52]
MEMSGLMGGFLRISEWIMRFAYANLVWLLFTLMGGVILGIFPATIALFTLTRKWLRGEPDTPVFTTCFKTFKQEFFKGNLFALIFAAIAYILFIDIQYLSHVTGNLYTFLLFIFVLVALLFIILFMYIFPVYVHFQLPFIDYLKYALLIGITNLHLTIGTGIMLALFYYLFMLVPGLVPFFSVSVPAYVTMWAATTAFKLLERKREKILAKEEAFHTS